MSERFVPNGGRIKVGIAIPSAGTWQVKFGQSLVSLVQKTMQWRPEPEEGFKSLTLVTYTKSSSMLVQSRHDLVVQALRDECTHLLFLDDDMVFPADLLIKLLQAKKEVIAVNCTTRTHPVVHIAHDLKGQVIDSRKKNGLQRVQHVGAAVMLLETDVLRRMDPPLFMMEWIPEMNAYCGEDVYFCMKLEALRIPIYIDHDLSHKVGHVGELAYGPSHIGVEFPDSYHVKER
jgi:hypothetical protein